MPIFKDRHLHLVPLTLGSHCLSWGSDTWLAASRASGRYEHAAEGAVMIEGNVLEHGAHVQQDGEYDDPRGRAVYG